MITLPQLKMLAKQNNIHYTCKNKDELIALLIDNNIITASDVINSKIIINTVKRNYDHLKHNYDHIKSIRTNPKTVEVFDKETGKITIFPSKYKTGRALGINPFYIKDGAIWKNRYIITVN